jgi:hypothetical protein
MSSKVFFMALLAATLFPYLAVPVLNLDSSVWGLAKLLLIFEFVGGSMHVAAGYFFAFEPRAQNILKVHWRSVGLPAVLLVLGFGALFASDFAALKAVALMAYFAWQTWHYHKQNVGVGAFFTRHHQQPPLSPRELLPMKLAVIGAILALVKLYGVGHEVISSAAAQGLWWLGLALQVLAVMFWAVWAWRIQLEPGARQRIGLVALGTLFYLPTYLWADPINAVASYALAHGLQYLVFMTYVGIRQTRPWLGLTAVLTLGVALGLVLFQWSQSTGSPFKNMVFGIYLALVMGHFLLDGVIWRLRLAPQRAYIGGIFSFVLGKPNQEAR